MIRAKRHEEERPDVWTAERRQKAALICLQDGNVTNARLVWDRLNAYPTAAHLEANRERD